MDKATINQHLQLTTEIWTNYTNLTPYEKKYRVKICTVDKFPFLNMNVSCPPEWVLKFGIFR